MNQVINVVDEFICRHDIPCYSREQCEDGGRDLLEEAGRIDRQDTLLLTTSAHLHAVIELVKRATTLIEGESRYNDAVRDWLRDAAKVTRA